MPKPLTQADVELKSKVQTRLDRDYPAENFAEDTYRLNILTTLAQFTADTPVPDRKVLRQELETILKELQEGEEEDTTTVVVSSSSSSVVSTEHTTAVGISQIHLEKQAHLSITTKNSPTIGKVDQYIQHTTTYSAIDEYQRAQLKEEDEFGALSPEESIARSKEKLAYFNERFREEYQGLPEPYIPLRGKERRDANAPVFEVNEKVGQFLQGPKKVLLLLGNAGSGKSRFTRELALSIEGILKVPTDYIPVFVQLPTLSREQLLAHLIEDTLRYHLGDRYVFTRQQLDLLKERLKILFILDSYDEAFPDKRFENLAVSNKLSEWQQSKIIFSCRTQDFIGNLNGSRQFFALRENGLMDILEINIEPFSPEHIKVYVHEYIKINAEQIENTTGPDWIEETLYHAYIFGEKDRSKKLTGLEELVQLPLSLKITMEALPEIVELYKHELDAKERARITERDLYEALFEQRFERQWDKRIFSGKAREMSSGVFLANGWEFAMQLAEAMGECTFLYYEPEAALRDNKRSSPSVARFFSNEPLPEDGKTMEEQKVKRAQWIAARDGCMIQPVKDGKRQKISFEHSKLKDFLLERREHQKLQALQLPETATKSALASLTS